VTGVDHPRQDGAGQVRLTGPGAAEQQQTTAAPAHLREAVCVGTAYLQCLTLPRRGRQVVLEGPVQKPPRNPAAPDRALELCLSGEAPLGGELLRLASTEGGQLLSGKQWGRARGSDRAGLLR